MEKNEKELNKKKLKRYERLGALKFQKVVFKVEKLKFKIIKKCFPNFVKYFDKYIDWQQKKEIKKAKSEDEIKLIKENAKLSKMALRKELNEEKNRNYHIDPKRPTEIFKYLEWNKKIHKKGLIKDAILIPILIAGTIFHVPGAVVLLAYELLSAAINFECINIQNYNIYRLERIKPRLEKQEESYISKNIEEYGAAAEVIHKSIDESETLPTFEEILANIDNVDQLKQMKALFKKTQEERQKQKTIGGK